MVYNIYQWLHQQTIASFYLSCAKRTGDNLNPQEVRFPYGSQLLLGQEDAGKFDTASSAVAAEFFNLIT